MPRATPLLRRTGGWTIVQIMVFLLIAGLVGKLVIDYVIEQRCRDNPSAEMCVNKDQSR